MTLYISGLKRIFTRIQALNYVCGNKENIIADLVETGNHASTKQGIIIKGSITDSSLMGPLEGQPISKLIKLIEEEKVSVNLYLSSQSTNKGNYSSCRKSMWEIIHSNVELSKLLKYCIS